MAGLRNKWPCNGFLVETEQEGAAGTLRETFDKLQYMWQNILAFHGSEERFFPFCNPLRKTKSHTESGTHTGIAVFGGGKMKPLLAFLFSGSDF